MVMRLIFWLTVAPAAVNYIHICTEFIVAEYADVKCEV
jgi:hypothetical protein